MKLGICFFLILMNLPAADRKTEKQASSAVKPGAISIPAGARRIAPGTFEHTDAAGKKWIYRQTPFGWTRFEDKTSSSERAEQQRKQAESMTAVEDGDSVRFERPGPFGRYRWTRKKTELDEVEQAVWNREREKTTAAQKETKE